MVAEIFSSTIRQEAAEMEGDNKNLLVGIRIDSEGHELLSWAVFKIAKPGSRIIALHVSRDSDWFSKNKASTISLAKSLNSFLASYQNVCSLKKVNLVGKLTHGKSIRKVIIQEAKECSAIALVLGVCRTSLGSSVSMAKYCAKRLPPSTLVVAIHNGKIMYQTDDSKSLAGKPEVSRKSSSSEVPGIVFDAQTQSNSENMDLGSKVFENLGSIQGVESMSTNLCKEANTEAFSIGSSFQFDDGESRNSPLISESKSDSGDLSPSCNSKFDSSEESTSESFTNEIQREIETFYSENIHAETSEEAAGLVTLLVRKFPEPHPGWPLLRKATMSSMEGLHSPEARKMPVVQWALQLPDRSPVSTPKVNVHEDESNRTTELGKELAVLHKRNSSSWRRFNHDEFETLSLQLSSGNLIGNGGCSKVYKVSLPNDKPLAVKISKSSPEAWKEFLLEVEIISSLQHKNIISLVGVYVEANSLISVYNFLFRGSLEYYLHGRNGKTVFPWKLRFNVALGVAEALHYLHNGCSRPVIHRDVKSSNILLSDDFEPLLSDFGLAMWAPTASTDTIQTDVLGTFGYLAPEYFMYGKVSDKVDVYSYGVVLLELLSGRKPISSGSPKAQESLIMWATTIMEKGNTVDLVDPKLDGKYDDNQMRRMIKAASLCIRRSARSRPEINLILRLLQGDEDVIRHWPGTPTSDPKDFPNQDEESYALPDIRSHLDVAFHDVEDDVLSVCSMEQNSHHFLESYLRGRCSRSSSFD